MSPLKRIRSSSHEGERIVKADRSMRAQTLSVRWAIVDIVLASGPKTNDWLRECKAVFVLYCPLRPQSSSFQGAQGLTIGTELISFHSSHLLFFFRYSAREITAWHCARTGSLWGPVLRSSKWVQDTAGKAVRYKESTTRTSGETNFSGVHKDSWQPAVPVLASSRSHLQQMLKNLVQAGSPRASSRDSRAQKE